MFLSQLEGFLDPSKLPARETLLKVAAALLGLAVVLAIGKWVLHLFGKSQPVRLLDPALEVDLSRLPIASTDAYATRLTVYHMPVRLGVVVIAPLGREAGAPTHSEMPELLDRVVPGLSGIPSHDQTIVKIWPQQLSATGFAHRFARHVRLPSDEGRGTPWCLVAGRTTFGDASYVVGLALGSATPNNLGLVVLEKEHQWLDVLRLRNE